MPKKSKSVGELVVIELEKTIDALPSKPINPAKKKTNFRSWVMSKLRSASYRWPPRNEALVAARVGRGQYKCAVCEEIFKRDQVQIDHIEPVISLKGFTTWDEVIAKLFCNAEQFQILCGICHDYKTRQEDTMRAFNNKQQKSVDKQKEKG